MKRVSKTVLMFFSIAALLSGCLGKTYEWAYSGPGWGIEVEHYDFPERIYYTDSNGYFTAPEGYKYLALWLTVANLDEKSPYSLHSNVSWWTVADDNGYWDSYAQSGSHLVNGLPTQEQFHYGAPKSGYIFFRVHEQFDIGSATLEFRFNDLLQAHMVVVDLSETQPLSKTI